MLKALAINNYCWLLFWCKWLGTNGIKTSCEWCTIHNYPFELNAFFLIWYFNLNWLSWDRKEKKNTHDGILMKTKKKILSKSYLMKVWGSTLSSHIIIWSRIWYHFDFGTNMQIWLSIKIMRPWGKNMVRWFNVIFESSKFTLVKTIAMWHLTNYVTQCAFLYSYG